MHHQGNWTASLHTLTPPLVTHLLLLLLSATNNSVIRTVLWRRDGSVRLHGHEAKLLPHLLTSIIYMKERRKTYTSFHFCPQIPDSAETKTVKIASCIFRPFIAFNLFILFFSFTYQSQLSLPPLIPLSLTFPSSHLPLLLREGMASHWWVNKVHPIIKMRPDQGPPRCV